MKENLVKIFDEATKVLEEFKSSDENLGIIAEAALALIKSFKNGKKVYSCGNGGSMSDAMHFAEELSARFKSDRRALPATAISDPAHISCVGNDYGYEHIFSRYLEAMIEEGDTLLAISTSGNSKNIINAVNVAKKRGAKVIGLLGKDGGKLKSLVDYPVTVKSKQTERIQEIHIKVIHSFIEIIERELFPGNY